MSWLLRVEKNTSQSVFPWRSKVRLFSDCSAHGCTPSICAPIHRHVRWWRGQKMCLRAAAHSHLICQLLCLDGSMCTTFTWNLMPIHPVYKIRVVLKVHYAPCKLRHPSRTEPKAQHKIVVCKQGHVPLLKAPIWSIISRKEDSVSRSIEDNAQDRQAVLVSCCCCPSFSITFHTSSWVSNQTRTATSASLLFLPDYTLFK